MYAIRSYYGPPPPPAAPCAVKAPAPSDATAEAVADDPTSPAAMGEELRSSVVQVATDISSGTGFIFSRRGMVLTALHVIEQAAVISVRWQDGRTVRARLSRRNNFV